MRDRDNFGRINGAARRALAALLSLLLVMSCLPRTALAEVAGEAMGEEPLAEEPAKTEVEEPSTQETTPETTVTQQAPAATATD